VIPRTRTLAAALAFVVELPGCVARQAAPAVSTSSKSVAPAIAAFSKSATPAAGRAHRLVVGLARFSGDYDDSVRKWMLDELSKVHRDIEVWPTELPGLPNDVAFLDSATAVERTRDVLVRSGLDLVVWGGVLRVDGPGVPSLFLAPGPTPFNAAAGPGPDITFYDLHVRGVAADPAAFRGELRDVLALIILSQGLWYDANRYSASALTPWIDRVQKVVDGPEFVDGSEGAWSTESRWTVLNSYARALDAVGVATSDTGALERSAASYRRALSAAKPLCGTDREDGTCRSAMETGRRAGTQIELGRALAVLGERESDAAILAQAVAAYRAAIEVYARDAGARLDLAVVREDLGIALRALAIIRSQPPCEAVGVHWAALEAFGSSSPNRADVEQQLLLDMQAAPRPTPSLCPQAPAAAWKWFDERPLPIPPRTAHAKG
jgi:hypothetical protein